MGGSTNLHYASLAVVFQVSEISTYSIPSFRNSPHETAQNLKHECEDASKEVTPRYFSTWVEQLHEKISRVLY